MMKKREKKKARISIDSGFNEEEEGGENKENDSLELVKREREGDGEGEGEGEGIGMEVDEQEEEEVPESENGDFVGERIAQVGPASLGIGMGMGERSGIGDPPPVIENRGVDEVVRNPRR